MDHYPPSAHLSLLRRYILQPNDFLRITNSPWDTGGIYNKDVCILLCYCSLSQQTATVSIMWIFGFWVFFCWNYRPLWLIFYPGPARIKILYSAAGGNAKKTSQWVPISSLPFDHVSSPYGAANFAKAVRWCLPSSEMPIIAFLYKTRNIK